MAASGRLPRDHCCDIRFLFFGQKLANAVAPAVLGLTLAAAGWQETTNVVVPQTDEALGTLQVSITLIPAVILIVAILAP